MASSFPDTAPLLQNLTGLRLLLDPPKAFFPVNVSDLVIQFILVISRATLNLLLTGEVLHLILNFCLIINRMLFYDLQQNKKLTSLLCST